MTKFLALSLTTTLFICRLSHYLAAQRQGTHKSKEKWEVSRTTKKAFRQKGTGGARRGSMKVSGVKGGARAFGPKPHLYELKGEQESKRPC
jgi:large subunit ribosomal protein L4